MARAPNLAQLLTYVCSKYFEGVSEQIKEYTIAVEAFGRPQEFDHRTDSIVRVEAHRLRKRLREYYEAEGAAHTIQIQIPAGQYIPKFVFHEPGGRVEGAQPPDSGDHDELPIGPALPVRRRWPWAFAFTVAAAVTLLLVYWVPRGRKPAYVAAENRRPDAYAEPAKTEDAIRIMSGLESGNYVDASGRTWQSDRYYEGGTVFNAVNHPISGTRDRRLYQTRREGRFSYHIPLKSGVYELRLHFAETVYGENNAGGGAETSRLFNVFVNEKEILHQLDVIAEAGASTAHTRVFKDISPASDGKLHIKLEPYSNGSILNAIEITPGLAGRLRPIRIIAQDHAYTDKNGRYWEPDPYSKGGQHVLRANLIEGADDPELYRGERFGNLSYGIPVPPGQYGITFHFAETWFGPGTAGGGGAGSRTFDILCNGIALRRGFDIYKEAGGPNRAVTWSVHNISPNQQGRLQISLLPVRNYACINALEVIDESK